MNYARAKQKAVVNCYLSCVEDRKNVGEGFMKRRQKTKQPREPQQWNQ